MNRKASQKRAAQSTNRERVPNYLQHPWNKELTGASIASPLDGVKTRQGPVTQPAAAGTYQKNQPEFTLSWTVADFAESYHLFRSKNGW
jgi:RecA-family ATPase